MRVRNPLIVALTLTLTLTLTLYPYPYPYPYPEKVLRFEELAAGLGLKGEVRNMHEYGGFVRLEVYLFP